MSKRLLLFDVDGTLISTRAGRHAFNRAFESVFGLRDLATNTSMAGQTDPLIFREICERHGLAQDRFTEWKGHFLKHLQEAVAAEPGDTLPGVRDLLEALRREPDFFLALGTGNVEEGARLKLEPHGLNPFFPTGGFGEDGGSRDQVIARAIARAGELYGGPFERVVVIGDTPNDIRCGRANRCRTVAVATGHYSLEQLRAHAPDCAVADLTDTHRMVETFRML